MKIAIYVGSLSPEMARSFLTLAQPVWHGLSGAPPLIKVDGVNHYATNVSINYDTACVTLECKNE